MARNHRIRFMDNNFAELISASATSTSALDAFPFSNAINKFRSKVWKPSGYFNITANNQNLFISTTTGVAQTVGITINEYSTPASLAEQIATDLNVVDSGWTCTHDSNEETYKFTIGNTSTVALRLSATLSSIWDDLGFTLSSDSTAMEFTADEQRNHTEESAIFDMGYNAEMKFFAAISPLDEEISVTSSATVVLEANNINSFDSPPFSVTLTKTKGGFLKFLDDLSDTAYRFWKFKIIDRLNPDGPEGLSIGHIYIGDYVTITNRNVKSGFVKSTIDPTEKATSEGGAIYFDKKTKYGKFGSMGIQYLDRADKDEIDQLFFDKGVSTPFYVSLDPTLLISDDLHEFTKYVVFETAPTFKHFKNDIFSMNLTLKELV